MSYYERLSRMNQGSKFGGDELPVVPQQSPQQPNRVQQMQQQIVNPIQPITNQQQPQRLSMLEPLSNQIQPRQAEPMRSPILGQMQQQQQAPRQGSVQAPNELQGLIGEVAKKNGVKADLINAIIKQESNFNPKAKSHAGAAGLMQLMPGTAKGLGVKNSYDPQQNVDGGSRYIKQMLQKYPDVRLALAAYNWGPGNVDKAIKKYGNNFEAIQKHMPKETRDYVPKILANMGMGG